MPEQYSPLGQQPYAPEQYSPLGLRPYAPEQYSPLGQQRPPDITADRTSLIQQTAAGQPVDPKAIQALDEQATTLFDEGMKGLRRFGYSTIATGQAFAGTMLAPMFPKLGNDLVDEGLRTIKSMPQDIQPAVQNWADVHDLRSGALKFVSSVGEGLPSSALTVGGILLGRGLGRGAAALGGARGAALETAANRAGWVGGAATMIPGEGGETALDLAQDPVAMANTTPWQRAGLVGARGTVNALLEEAVPQALVVPHLLGKAARIAPGFGAGLRNVGLLAGEGAIGEYGTEFVQDLTGQYAQNVAHPGTGYSLQSAHEAGLSGAATGIFMGGAGGAAQAVHSNIGAGVDLAKEGVAKVRNKLPSFDDVLRHTLNALDDPEGAGRALAGATLEGIAKAGEAAGAFKDYAVKGVAPVEDFLSKTYDNTVKFIGKNVDDPELRNRLFQRAAELKTMTMPEWSILKRDISEAGGTQFMENVGAAATVGARRAVEGAKNVFKWGSDAVKGFVSGLGQDTEGKASISAPDANDRATAMAQFYAAAPGLKDVVEKMAPSLNAKRDMANMLHYAINNSQFLEGAAHDPARADALAQWTAHTGTDLNKIVGAIREHRNDVTFEQVAADKASNMMHQLGINPEHHDDLIEMVRSADGADYDALPASQQRLLFGMAGKNELKSRALYAALESSLDKGQLAMERQVGEAGRVKSQIPALSEAMQTGTVTGAATSSDEGGTTGKAEGYYDELNNRYGEVASELSPFNKEAVQQSLTTKGYENAPGTRIPITLTPQGEHANLNLKTLANALGERHQDKQTKEETWHPFKQGREPVTKRGVQLHINPMSLTSMIQSEKFRDQFHEHMIGLDDRPGASSDEITSQRFMNALAALQDKGIHLNPEDVGLPKEGAPVHVKVGVDLAKLHDDLIIRQYKGGKHKLTWADVSGKTRKLMNPAKHLERLQKFNGNFTGAYQTLEHEGEEVKKGGLGNKQSEKIAGVIWRRARNQLRETAGLDQFAPVRNPTPAELDAAAKAYHDAIPGMQQAREQQRAIREQMTDLRNAYRDETVSAQNLEDLADWYGHEKGSNLAKAGVAAAAIHDKVIDRKAVDTSKLAEQIREMVATADLGREAFSKSVTGSDITRSTESDILGDWLEFKNTAAQKAERYREGTQAIASRKGEQSTAPSTREQVPPQPGHSLAVTWNINGKQLARSAAKYEITASTQLQNGGHKFSFKNIETGKEYKNYIVNAEGVSQTGSKFHFLGEPKVTKATPEDYAKPATTTPAPTAPKPAAAAPTTGVTKTMGMWYRDGNLIGGVRHEMLPAFRGKSTLDLIKSGDRTATTRPLDQVRGVKEGDLIRFAASGQEPVTVRVTKAPYPVKDVTPAQWSKLEGWKPELYDNYKNAYQFQYERVQPGVDAARGRGMMTLPERYAEIRTSAPQDKVTFLNKRLKNPLTHTDLNNLVQEWANKYLPGVPVTLHIYAKQSGDPRGFVDRQIGANTIYIANEHADRIAALATTAHEFGHLLQYNHFNEASAEVKKSIFAAYNADIKALTSGKLTTEQAIQRFGNAANAIIQRNELGDDSALRDRMQGAILGGTVHTDEELEYATSFREWFANQFSKMVTSGLDRPVTMAERSFWDALSKKVKDFYNAVVKKLTPSTAYENWVKELAKSQGDVTSAAIDGATPPPPKPPSPPPPPGPRDVPPGGSFPNDEAKQRFINIVHSMMGDKKVQILFDQKLAAGVKGTFSTRREKLDQLGKLRVALVNNLKDAQQRNAQKSIDDLTDQLETVKEQEAKLIADTAVQGTIELATGMEKKNGLAEHETFHAAFKMFFDENERRIMGQAFTNGLAGARLREIFKDDPVVLARIDPLTGSAEEAAAYAFQIWAQDPSQFQLGPKTETIFQKMINFVRKIVGVLTLDEKAQMIMESLKSGRRYEQNISPVQKILDKDTAWKERAQKMAQDVGGLLKQGYDILLSPARERLIDTDNPALTKIARLAYQLTGEEGNEGGMTQRGRKQFRAQQNELGRIFDKLTEPQLQELHQHMVMGTTLSDPIVAERAKQLHSWFRDMYAYQTKAGVQLGNMGVKEDYYPLTWSPEKVLKNKQAFIDMLEQSKYAEKMLILKKTPNELYNSITSYIDRGEDLVNVMGQNNEPLSESSKARTLGFLDKTDRIPFMDDDPIHTSFRYMKQAIRQAEYVRSFGENGVKLKAMKEEAKDVYGATPDQLALVNDYIDGTLGNKEVGMSRELKDLYGALNVYENYRLLPFNLFSSLIDPMGIAIRSNSVRDAWETFSYSIKGLFNEWKKDYPRDFFTKYAEDMGIIEHSGTTISAHNQFDGITLRGTTKSLNDKLFKYNLLNGWVRNNTIMATKAGQRFIYRAAEGDFGKHSQRYLDELGLTKDDVIYDKTQERLLLYADELEAAGMSKADAQALETKMGNAIEKFVRQSLLNPNSAELPNWMSNPYMAPIAHLKQFVFSFEATILERVKHEMKHDNFKPVALAASYVPAMIAADFMKDMIAGFGDEPPYKKGWGFFDYFNDGVQRSGLLGSGQFFTSMQEDIARGGGGYETAFGPAAQQLQQGVKAFSSGDGTAIKNWMIKSGPLMPVYKQHLISGQQGGGQGSGGGGSSALGLVDDVVMAAAKST